MSRKIATEQKSNPMCTEFTNKNSAEKRIQMRYSSK